MSDEELQAQLDAVASTLTDLEGRASFSNHKSSIAELDANLPELKRRVEGARTRGYLYKSYLEHKVETLNDKWKAAKPRVQRELKQAETTSEPAITELKKDLRIAQANKRKASSAKQTAERAEAKIREIESAIDAHYSEVMQAYYQTDAQIRNVEWTLDQIDEATFELLADELPIEAAKAQWYRDGKKKGPEGVLYLTDQRIIFEQKEKKATKKVLFIATEKEMIQEMLMAESVATIEKIVPVSTGLIKTHTLELEFGAGANTGNTTFQVKGEDPKMWATLVKRIKNSQIQSERVYREGEEAGAAAFEDSLANAPSECTACGAPVPAITQGQRQAQCEYCGSSMTW